VVVKVAMANEPISRRHFLAVAGAAPAVLPLALADRKRASIPVGLEMYSLREDEKRDMPGTLKAVAAMGYEGVEFWGMYADWTPAHAKEIRGLLDGLGLRCFSTHNRRAQLEADALPATVELNRILGSRYAVMASPGEVKDDDGWKGVADLLTRAHETLKGAGLKAGYHNHEKEWKPLADGRRPMDVLTAGTPADFAFQLDIGNCLAGGGDPLAFIERNAARLRSYHVKDWSADPEKGYKVLIGEGSARWDALIEAAERSAVEYYLVEQEGGRLTPRESVWVCLEEFRRLRSRAR
jgi:sugar phosphate isomerase/epimerase